jgi:hypothetical protein
MLETFTRRAVLARTPAVIVAAGATSLPVAAFASGGNDQLLLDLIDRLPGAQQRQQEANERADKCFFATREEFPELPAIGREAQCSLAAGPDSWPDARETIEEIYQGQVRKRMLALYEDWTSHSRAILEQRGWPALNQEEKAAVQAIQEIEQAIIDTPADTVVGIQVKLRLLDEHTGFRGGDPHSHLGDPALLISIAEDVERLAGDVS